MAAGFAGSMTRSSGGGARTQATGATQSPMAQQRQRVQRKNTPSIYGMQSLESVNEASAPLASTSRISTANPVSGSAFFQYARATPASRSLGPGAGDRSRDAFAQAMARQQTNQYATAAEDAGRDFQLRAQQARAADIYNQRADQVRRYGLQEGYKQDRRGIELSEREDAKNIKMRLAEAGRNRDAEMRSGIINSLFGGGLLSAGANARIAQAQGQPFWAGGWDRVSQLPGGMLSGLFG